MPIVRIEHPVPDYAAWKQAFDSDPMGREQAGVRRYQVMRATDDPNHVLVDLDFETQEEADAFVAAIRVMWERVAGTIMTDPKARIVEAVESREY